VVAVVVVGGGGVVVVVVVVVVGVCDGVSHLSSGVAVRVSRRKERRLERNSSVRRRTTSIGTRSTASLRAVIGHIR